MKQHSKKPIPEFQQEFIKRMKRTIKVLEGYKKDLEKYPHPLNIDEKWLQTFEKGTDELDKRVNVVKKKGKMTKDNTIRIIALITAILDWNYSLYVQKIWNPRKISSKQIRKILRGRVKKVELLYDPKNRREALKNSFYGLQCEKCKSWRVDEKYMSTEFTTLYCCACGKEWITKCRSQKN